MKQAGIDDGLLYGRKREDGLVAVERLGKRGEPDSMLLFIRRDGQTVERREPFRPFIIADPAWLEGCPGLDATEKLSGKGPLAARARFESWSACLKARTWLARNCGYGAGAPNAPYYFVNDPVQQYLMDSGRTFFGGMQFGELRRMQVDIECLTSEGYEFCNAEREGDCIAAIGMADQSGWTQVLSGLDMTEQELLEAFVAVVRERDPDVIEGHNIFNFDLPYLAERARRYGVKLALGRDGSKPSRRPSRVSMGERAIAYDRFDIFGRQVVDTLFLVHAYDVAHRTLDGFGLKAAARHFGLERPGRTLVDGNLISATFRTDPERILAYVRDDVLETGALGALLSQSAFVQAGMLPLSYQNVCVRGNATKIDALMVREYLARDTALPLPEARREFAGGYADLFVEGVVHNVHHCDVRSLYPSLMLAENLGPRADELGVFPGMLGTLRDLRVDAKQKMQSCADDGRRMFYEALQGSLKILINSFYGYLGFAQGRFCDFSAAGDVTEAGRSLLVKMIEWLRAHEAVPVEIDTDGIYFVPPEGLSGEDQAAFRAGLAQALPKGIEIEFDGEYQAMFSYKMKNYALLTRDGEMILKGAALKSRGLEPFQRKFLREVIRRRLTGDEATIPALRQEYEEGIRSREWPIEMLAKTERLQDSPATYAAKRDGGKRSRSAVYELALLSGRDYRAGDQLSYYVTGERKSVAVHENARLVSDWNAASRDENVPYYTAKLEALFRKFGGMASQREMDL